MSTFFGILKSGGEIILENDELPTGYTDEDFIEVAFRNNNGIFWWTNSLSEFLPSNTRIYPLDNSASGIYTTGDIKQKIKEQI
jgi:hypothetical protein